ncbi:phage major capsid protein [Leptotrichia trevisanii]|uniref:phage major capsid protein n=1 Tax=Leptotrichia trevisanii TaxID=109328 RepID=UPI00040A87EB|nr:phage major capsid protein [Leptotrichia trevisanii]
MDKFQKSVEMILKKDTEEKGIIEGQLVTHSVIDSYGDYFDKTALDKVDKDKTYFLLHMHDWSKEIGTLKVYQDETGNLKFSAKLDLSTDENGNAINQDAQKVYSMMKNGANYEMSVGGFLKQREFGRVQTDKGEVDARIIKEIEVVEGSVVLKGAVPDATVETVKGKNINKNEGDDNMPKNIEDLEKGMNQNTEDIKKANEDLTGALKKNKELEEKIDKANEELEKMGKTLDEVMKKGVANPETEEKKETEALQKFLRTGEAGNLRVAKAISSTQVAVLIPSALEREILKEIKENSPFLFNARIYTGKESYRRVPIRNEITAKNQAVKEGIGNTQSGEISYTYIDIKAGKRQVPYPLTDEAREDAFADLVGEIKEAVAEDFGITLSDLTINGTYNETADQFIEGFMTNADVKANAVTSVTAGKVTWEDMVKLETGMKKQYRKNAKYYVSTKMYEEMKLWKDTTDRQLWSTIHNGATMIFNGYEVVVDEFLDDIATGKFPAIFCDFKKGYGYYIKNDFEQETNRKVNEGITEIYTRIRIGGKVLRPNAFKPLKVK